MGIANETLMQSYVYLIDLSNVLIANCRAHIYNLCFDRQMSFSWHYRMRHFSFEISAVVRLSQRHSDNEFIFVQNSIAELKFINCFFSLIIIATTLCFESI